MTNKNQITYLFGAGASSQAIPTIDGLLPRIDSLVVYLKDIKEIIENGKPDAFLPESVIKRYETLVNIIDELEWLKKESASHQTVDTLAKKLFVQGKYNLLSKLKRALISYFFFEQNISFPKDNFQTHQHELFVDKRYDNLIACISERNNNSVELKGHIKFITWNYDLQIDLALRNYLSENISNINRLKNENNIHPNQNSYDLINGQLIDINNFGAIKLNGNAFLDNTFDKGTLEGRTIYDYRFKNPNSGDLEILGEFLTDYSLAFSNVANVSNPVYRYFNFAWEKDEKYLGHQNVVSEAVKIMEATKVLIIVGYSFPYFNSEIDKLLFAKCNPKEIIIQDLVPEEIEERILQLLFQNNISPDSIKIKKIPPGKYFPIHQDT